MIQSSDGGFDLKSLYRYKGFCGYSRYDFKCIRISDKCVLCNVVLRFFIAIEIVPQVGEQFEIGESKKNAVQK